MSQAPQRYGLLDCVGDRLAIFDTSALFAPGSEPENLGYIRRNERYHSFLRRFLQGEKRILTTSLLVSELDNLAEKNRSHSEFYSQIRRVAEALRHRRVILSPYMNQQMTRVFDMEDLDRYEIGAVDRHVISLATVLGENEPVAVFSNDRELVRAGIHVASSGRVPVAYFKSDENRYSLAQHDGNECKACWENELGIRHEKEAIKDLLTGVEIRSV